MEPKEKEDKNEDGPLNLYKKTILWTKLSEAMQEMKEQNKISPSLEKIIIEKLDQIICQELATCTKSKNTISGRVSSFRNCDDIWIFYCNDVNLRIDKEVISIPKLKIIALDEKLKAKNKESDKYSYNQVAENI